MAQLYTLKILSETRFFLDALGGIITRAEALSEDDMSELCVVDLDESLCFDPSGVPQILFELERAIDFLQKTKACQP